MSADKKKVRDPQRIFFALEHPLRRRIFFAVNESATPLSPTDFVKQLSTDDPRAALSNAAYHFRVLTGLGLIEPVRQEAIRGSVKKFFAITAEVTPDLLNRLMLE